MRALFLAAAMIVAAPTAALSAPLEIVVFLSAQTMNVMEDGETIHEWSVSTGKEGKSTPPGTFTPQFLSPNHKSSKYNNAPMPFAVFYSGDYAIHGGPYEAKIGTVASRGCVRLATVNAETLFGYVEHYGLHNVEIRIVP